MYYHSVEWGFDKNYLKKKESARSFLIKNEFTTCLAKKCNSWDLENMFEFSDSDYLVIAFPVNDEKDRKGFFNISSLEQLQHKIYIEYGSKYDFDEFNYYFIEQMKKMKGCFTATIISNGKGDLIVEYLTNTIDNRELTSGTNHETTPGRIIFLDFELVECDNYEILKILFGNLKKCLWLKGYYELSYAIIKGKKDVCFSYYSNEPIYMNFYKISRTYNFDLYNRCIYKLLKETGYLY